MASLSVLIGILALVLAIIPIGLTQLAGVAAGLVAVILGVLGRRRAAEEEQPQRRATVGLWLGVGGAVLSGLLFAAFISIMDRISDEVQGASASAKARLGEEMTREFGRARGTKEFHEAMKRVLKRAEKDNAVK